MIKKGLLLIIFLSVTVVNGSNNKNNRPRQTYNPNVNTNFGNFQKIAKVNRTGPTLMRCGSCGQSFMNNIIHSCPLPKRNK